MRPVSRRSVALVIGGSLLALGSALAWGAVGLDMSGLGFGHLDVGPVGVGDGAISLIAGVSVAAFGLSGSRRRHSALMRSALMVTGLVVVAFTWIEWTRVDSAAMAVWEKHSTWTSYLGEAPGIRLVAVGVGGVAIFAAGLLCFREA